MINFSNCAIAKAIIDDSLDWKNGIRKKSAAGAVKPAINKSFLSNTMKSVGSHNRREEISDCWREHAMMEQARKRKRPVDQRYREPRGETDSQRPSSSSRTDEEERVYWAQLKTLKTQPEPLIVDANTTTIASDSDSEESSNGHDKKSVKHKKHKNKKKHKKSHKHHKKHKSVQ